MKTLQEDSLALCILLILFSIGKDTVPIISGVMVCIIWLRRHKNRSIFAVVGLLVILACPRWSQKMPSFGQGRVVFVTSSSAIIENGRYRCVIYPDEMPVIDQVYSFEPSFEPVQESSHFFTSSYSSYLKHQGVFWQITDHHPILKTERSTFRSFLFTMIQKRDPQERSILLRTVLNISDADLPYSWLHQYGFSFGGIVLVADGLLRYILDEKKRKWIRIVLSLFLYFSFGCPIIVLLYLSRDSLSVFTQDRYTGCGWSLIVPLLINPDAVFSFAYIITAGWRICTLTCRKGTWWPITITTLMQSLSSGISYPLINLLYRSIMIITGICWYAGLFHLIYGIPLFIPFYQGMQICMNWLQIIHLQGSIKGAGIFFFAGFLWTMRKMGHLDRVVLISYAVFCMMGLFHPFMEISFINVGQGDSILIRGPFASSNILVDTGKPSCWKTVDTFLQAKGIDHLDGLIITHSDDDHDGNLEAVKEKYSPSIIIDEHADSFTIEPFVFHDLNPCNDDNENRSSLMHWFTINGMQVMLCGDGDETSEETIVRTYGSLPVHLLKAGHHGSSTSSSDLFLDTMQPQLVIFSAGSPSLYHHPSDTVIQRMLARHIPYLNTYEAGDITILAVWKWNILFASNGMISILPF